MPLFSRFTPFGHLAFSSKRSHGEAIFQILKDNFGDSFTGTDHDLHQARLYATAMVFGSAQYQVDRAKNNKIPATATELLGVLENDYQVVPSPKARLPERRAYLAAVQRIKRGNRREAIEDALRTLLGTDFIEYRTAIPGTGVQIPSNPALVSVFAARGTQKKVFSINAAISTLNTPIVLPFTSIGGTGAPLRGEKYCVDPDPRCAIEQVAIESATATTITARFNHAHDPGTFAVSPYPYWASYQRYDKVVVSVAAAKDPETRRKINELMGRALRGVSQWAIMHNAGTLTCDDSTLGALDRTPVA